MGRLSGELHPHIFNIVIPTGEGQVKAGNRGCPVTRGVTDQPQLRAGKQRVTV